VTDALTAAKDAAVHYEQAAEEAYEAGLRRHPRWRIVVGVAGWVLVGIYFAFASIFLGLRYWILPNIGMYTTQVENTVSRVIGEKVTIGGISAGWDGLHPELDITELNIHDRDGRLALSLPTVEAVVSWSSVLLGSVRFQSLAFDRPDLEVRRDAQGRLYVAGMELKADASSPDASNWLLAQSEIIIRDAHVTWTDEKRAAPKLELAGVNLLMRNGADRHRFAFRAQTARELASALDIRGDFRGDSLARLDAWTGQLYAELDYTDLAAWQRWIDYPFDLQSGSGGVRLWLGVAGGRLSEFTADVGLSQVVTRLSRELPMLELDYLRGRLGARNTDKATDVFGKGLALRNKQGVTMPPADISLRVEPGIQLADMNSATAAETATKAAEASDTRAVAPKPVTNRKGSLTASTFELQPLAQLAEYLPFPAAFRKRLAEVDPRGTINALKVDWSGDPEHPSQYEVRGKFARVSLRASGGIPGFSGMSGSIDATQKGGTVSLSAEKSTLELPGILAEDGAKLDTLSGQLGWNLHPDHFEVRISNLAVANPDAAGTFSATYSSKAGKPGGPGVIDLTGNLTRADGRAAWRYIPWLPVSVRDYLKGAVVAAPSNEVRIRLKGDLAQFPFETAKAGTFQVAARVNGGEFNYADGWPRTAGIAGDLLFEGKSMKINAQRATVLGARLNNVRAVIPDLFHHSEILTVDGQAEAPTQEFLRFIDASPLAKLLDGATEDMRATGSGRLQLKLDIPLRKLDTTRVSGGYLFQNNQITLDPDVPPIAQASGRLDFTEGSISGRGLTGQFLGGPVSVALQTRGDGSIAVSAQGTAAMTALRRYVDTPLAARVTGTAPWRSNVLVKKRQLEMSVESTLLGVAIDLPAPFGKSATDNWTLRVDRGVGTDSELLRRLPGLRTPPRGDAIAVSLGTSAATGVAGTAATRASAVLVRRLDGKSLVADRGVVALNAEAGVPDRAGVVVTGSLAYLDADRWQALLDEPARPAAPATAGAAGPVTTPAANPGGPVLPVGFNLSGINVRVGMLDVAGKRFNDVATRMNASTPVGGATQWSGTVTARELSGDVNWRPEGRGRVQARLKQLTIPEDRPPVPGVRTDLAARELPGLDIVADEFVMRDRRFGKLELQAANEGRDWRIEKLALTNPDGAFTADGTWQSWAARPSIALNVKLNVTDAGKYLDRMGFPKTMQAGAAKLDGRIAWAGSPQSIDYATLSGNLSLSAEKGQFLKADPGVAKLLGVLSLQSLITLDLRDMFREGFSYDNISATANVAKGVLTTDDFRMKGAAALVTMNGTVDLARETQNLRMRIVPSLGDGASTIATLALANPALGLITTVLQRLLKDPLGQIFALEYNVTGGWNDPKVERTKVDAPGAAVKQ
jgi:uncharacterized protein (TIGR02099 family)